MVVAYSETILRHHGADLWRIDIRRGYDRVRLMVDHHAAVRLTINQATGDGARNDTGSFDFPDGETIRIAAYRPASAR